MGYGHASIGPVTGINDAPPAYGCARHLIEPRNPLYPAPAGCPYVMPSTAPPTSATHAPLTDSTVTASAATPVDATLGEGQLLQSTHTTLPMNTATSYVLPLDGSSPVTFSVISDHAVTMSLITPDGVTITPTTTMPGITFQQRAESDGGEGSMVTYILDSPSSGSWQVVIATTTNTTMHLMAETLSTTTLAVAAPRDTYQPGDMVPVLAAVLDNDTVRTSAVFTGTVNYRDGTTAVLTFVDNGTQGDQTAADGIATAQFVAPAIPGYTEVTVQATDGLTVREHTTILGIATKTAQLQGVTDVTTPDTNGDGFANTLDMVVEVATTAASTYDIRADLVDVQGTIIASTSQSLTTNGAGPLATGVQTTTLSFDGETIRTAGRPGPYTLTNVNIRDQATYGSFTVDWQTNVYTTTTAYLPSQFEGALLRVQNTSESISDTDGDGLTDTLDVRLNMEVRLPGTYTWNGSLKDSQGNTLAQAKGESQISGPGAFVFRFAGQDIRFKGTDGPYVLSDVTISQTDGPAVFFGFNLHTTQPYTATSFDVGDCQDLFEPDGEHATAQVAAMGTTQPHAFCHYQDQDWVALDAETGTTYRIALPQVAATVQPHLTIYDPDGTTVLLEQSLTQGTPAWVDFTAPTTGRYTILLTNTDAVGRTESTYTLRITPIRCDGTDGFICVQMTAPTVTASEQDDVIILTATLLSPITSTVAIDYRLDDETASGWTDYGVPTDALSFTPDAPTQSITVPILLDSDVEPDETFVATLVETMEVVARAPASTQVTIQDDDREACLTDPTEPNDSASQATLLTLSDPQSHQFCGQEDQDWVQFTAEAGTTYVLSTQTTEFLDTSVRIFDTDGVTLLGEDDDSGDNGTSRVTWTAPASGTFFAQASTVWLPAGPAPTYQLLLTDQQVTVGIAAPWVRATDDLVEIPVALDQAATRSVTVAYTTSNGTGQSGTHYTATSGTLTFAPGETAQLIRVPVAEPDIHAAPRTFAVHLSAVTGPAILVNDTTTVTISTLTCERYEPDNDPAHAPQVALNHLQTRAICAGDGEDWLRVAADAGTPYAVELTSARPIIVELYDADGTTLLQTMTNTDYILSLPWTAAASQDYLVRLRYPGADSWDSPAYQVRVKEVRPVVSMAYPAINAMGTEARLTITLDEASTVPVTVQYASQDETAVAGSDYLPINGTVTFAPGELTQVITATVLPNDPGETDEHFGVTLHTPTRAVPGETMQTTVTILANGCEDTYEPNDTALQAQELSLSTPQPHRVCTPDDQDWLHFTAEAGKQYRFTTDNTQSGVDTVIELYAEDGTTLLASDDNGGAKFASRLKWTAPTTGTFYLNIQAYLDEGGPPMDYTLHMEDLSGPTPDPTTQTCTDPFEPNDTPETATAIATGESHTHRLCQPGESDWIAFYGEPYQTYDLVAVGGKPTVDVEFAVYDSDGVLLQRARDYNNGAQAWFNAPAHGMYYVRVQHATPTWGDPSYTYTFSLNFLSWGT